MYTGPAIMYGINMLVLFVMVIGYMLSVSVEFTLYVLLPLPVLSVSVYYINSEIQRRSDLIQKSLSGLSTFVQEAFSGIRVIKAFGWEEDSERKFSEESQLYRDRSIHLGNLNAWFSPVSISLIFVQQATTGNDTISSGASIRILPNPADGGKAPDIVLQCFEGPEAEMEISDILGRVLYQQKWPLLQGAASLKAPVSGFPTGVCLLKLRAGKQSLLKRMVLR